MRYRATHRQDGSIKVGTFKELSDLDKRVWHLEPVIQSIRKARHTLKMIRQGKTSKQVVTPVPPIIPVSSNRKTLWLEYGAIEGIRLVSALHYNLFSNARLRLFNWGLV